MLEAGCKSRSGFQRRLPTQGIGLPLLSRPVYLLAAELTEDLGTKLFPLG